MFFIHLHLTKALGFILLFFRGTFFEHHNENCPDIENTPLKIHLYTKDALKLRPIRARGSLQTQITYHMVFTGIPGFQKENMRSKCFPPIKKYKVAVKRF